MRTLGERSQSAAQLLYGVASCIRSVIPAIRAGPHTRAPLAPFYAAAWSSRSRARWTWWAPWRVHWPRVRVRCPVAFSWSATFAHERPARRCSMMAASVSCAPWCHSRRWMRLFEAERDRAPATLAAVAVELLTA